MNRRDFLAAGVGAVVAGWALKEFADEAAFSPATVARRPEFRRGEFWVSGEAGDGWHRLGKWVATSFDIPRNRGLPARYVQDGVVTIVEQVDQSLLDAMKGPARWLYWTWPPRREWEIDNQQPGIERNAMLVEVIRPSADVAALVFHRNDTDWWLEDPACVSTGRYHDWVPDLAKYEL